MQNVVMLARLGVGELAALGTGVLFVAIMAYLLLSGENPKEPDPPTRRAAQGRRTPPKERSR